MEQKKLQQLIDQLEGMILLYQKNNRCELFKLQVTLADKKILYGLYRRSNITKGELAKDIALEHSSLTRSLIRLEEQGMIKRNTHTEDKRFIKLSLTTKGLKKTEILRKNNHEFIKHAMQGVSWEKANAFIDVLDTMKKNMIDILSEKKETES